MPLNAAGLDVSGEKNPRWKGGLLHKVCEVCSVAYAVKRTHAASQYRSLQCVGVSQRGKSVSRGAMIEKACEVCKTTFEIYRSHANRKRCCSAACSAQIRATESSGDRNPNWAGGVSRLPYPWNFKQISQRVIAECGGVCQNPDCSGTDPRMTTHHIDYDKQNCGDDNLIALCSACNSKANFGRSKWQRFYRAIKKQPKKLGGGWVTEAFE